MVEFVIKMNLSVIKVIFFQQISIAGVELLMEKRYLLYVTHYSNSKQRVLQEV